MSRIIILLFLVSILFSGIFVPQSSASAFNPGNNGDKFVNVVIPVRGRDYWGDLGKVTPVFEMLENMDVPATLLLQYAAVRDRELTDYVKGLPQDFEIGLFLEVDESLANVSYASYLYGIGDRAQANIILLSGYGIDERKRMIDENMKEFRKVFGKYPSSIGAWYIDSVSASYLKKKYGIKTILDVADQWSTDTYGIWGKPWVSPYSTSGFNSLFPADRLSDIGLVTIQWAPRDPLRSYGLSAFESTYSVQANDYVKGHNLGIDYFAYLADLILSGAPSNKISQLTVGLEAGQESARFLGELENQVEYLKGYKFLTMSEFASIFVKSAPEDSGNMFTGVDPDSEKVGFWFNFGNYRAFVTFEDGRVLLKDLRLYAFPLLNVDVFGADYSGHLLRVTPFCVDSARFGNPLVLETGIRNVSVREDDGGYILSMAGKKGEVISLKFRKDGISKGKKMIFEAGSGSLSKILKTSFYKLIIAYQAERPPRLAPGLKLTELDGTFYFGVSDNRESLFAVRSKSPFIGRFYFPFQVLSKFKSLDFDRILFAFAPSFVNPGINCKINL